MVKSNAEINLKYEHYTDLLKPVLDYINEKSDIPIEELIPVAIRLAYLETIARGSLDLEQVNIKNILSGQPKEEISNELRGLLSVFEEKFIVRGIIKENSKVAYNPNFGLSSLLVDGADADIIIDGTLYDFKTSKDNNYSSIDSEQLIGYYLLNELSIQINHYSYHHFSYEGELIKRLALYKARFGEIEYYDLNNLSSAMKSKAIQKMAAYFLGETKKLVFSLNIDIDECNCVLKRIRDEEELIISEKGLEYK